VLATRGEDSVVECPQTLKLVSNAAHLAMNFCEYALEPISLIVKLALKRVEGTMRKPRCIGDSRFTRVSTSALLRAPVSQQPRQMLLIFRSSALFSLVKRSFGSLTMFLFGMSLAQVPGPQVAPLLPDPPSVGRG
jgi:hypothetical protein